MQGTFIQRFHLPFPSQAFPLRPGLGGLGEEGDGQDRREQAGAAPNYRRTSLTPRRPVSELQSPHSGLRPPNPTSIWSAEPARSRACFLQKSSGYHRACLTALGLRQTPGTAQRSRPRRRNSGECLLGPECAGANGVGGCWGAVPRLLKKRSGKTAGARCPRGLEEEQGSLVGQLLACKRDLVSDWCPRAESTPAPLLKLQSKNQRNYIPAFLTRFSVLGSAKGSDPELRPWRESPALKLLKDSVSVPRGGEGVPTGDS